MAVIAATSRGSVVNATRTTLTASDTLTYVPGTGQVLEVTNDTGSPLTVVIKGSAPSAAYPIPGTGGTTIDLSAGKSTVIATAKSYVFALDTLSNYLTGNNTVTVSGGTAGVATLIGA